MRALCVCYLGKKCREKKIDKQQKLIKTSKSFLLLGYLYTHNFSC